MHNLNKPRQNRVPDYNWTGSLKSWCAETSCPIMRIIMEALFCIPRRNAVRLPQKIAAPAVDPSLLLSTFRLFSDYWAVERGLYFQYYVTQKHHNYGDPGSSLDWCRCLYLAAGCKLPRERYFSTGQWDDMITELHTQVHVTRWTSNYSSFEGNV